MSDAQNQVPAQPQPTVPQAPVSPIATPATEPGYEGNIWKVVSIILIGVVAVFSLLAWYGFQLEEQDRNLSINSQNISMNPLTAEKIKNFKVAVNVGNDYFIGSPEEQRAIVDSFVSDNSASDALHLYLAANTAQLLSRPKDAMFLFFAAQLRKSFDYQRFALGDADGDNIQTYLGYLNEGAGQSINPLAIQNPKFFSEAIRMIETWSVVPADTAYYPKGDYGEAKLARDQWQAVADAKKESFLTEFAYKQEKLLNDPKMLEAMRFIQDYNFGKIPQNTQNDQKYEDYLKVVNALTE